jgi:DtxR family transcriptional regulator, Mn-dependent transcriptional regulator
VKKRGEQKGCLFSHLLSPLSPLNYMNDITDREEDYLKAIYTLSHGADTSVAPGDLVTRLGVSSAAVTRMTQRLAEAGLVRRTAYQGMTLTATGRHHALRVLRNHRLAEVFLVRELGYDWADVDETVDSLEHAMTDEFTNRLEERLNYPPACPHGDPIPNRTLQVELVRERPLTTVPVGQRVVISRVTGDKAMFRYLATQDLVPGSAIILKERVEVGGLWMIEREGNLLPLSPLVAGAIFVKREE